MNIFLTTTLPYVNSKPHMGHAFEFIFGDVIARKLRSQDDTEVVFNIGLDEHGVKVWEKANELGITPEQHCDRMTDVWIEFCEKFNIEYDIFYKTSSLEHHKRVKTIWNLMVYGDDIYKKHYKGQYCKGCEAYKTPKDLVNGQCPDHNLPGYVIDIEEENYFFRITKYRQAILDYVTEATDLLVPYEKRTELINIINESEDISISRLRENCPWGVEVPGDPTQTIYVWFDALLNYIFAAGYLTPNFKWQNVIQICGPDNLRFQGLIFQTFLSALKIPFTNRLLVHGTILDDQGKKMSKSLGNTVDPMEQLEKYGVDAIRYYAVACINNYQDSSWKESELVNKFNADMCDDFGNLVARVTHLCEKNHPAQWHDLYMIDDNPEFKNELNERFERVEAAWRKYDLNEAFRELNGIAKFGNVFISEKKPWLYKTEEEIWPILTCLTSLLYWLAEYYSVIAPERCEEIKTALIQHKKIVAFTKITLK